MVLSIHSETVRIKTGQADMEGALWLPDEHTGVILFAGEGNGNRLKPPSDYVASALCNAHLATLWLDLPAPQLAHNGRGPPDASALPQRLDAACDWLAEHGADRNLPIGLLGTGNGANAVLQLAASHGRRIAAVVLRGGRPDPSFRTMLGKISAPTLLIVGGLDEAALPLNRAIYAALRCKKRFEIIPGATRSFGEPGSLEVVARLARSWFLRHTGVRA
jgi:putative phosphoribosyl transferase